MKYAVPKPIEVMVAVSVTLQDFNFVVTALSKSISDRSRKRVEDIGGPVNHGLSAFSESLNATIVSRVNPIRQSGFGGISVIAIQDFQKIFFVEMSCTKRG